MSYVLSGTTIKAPQGINETNNTQVSQIRTLGGNITRDYFGSNKRQWVMSYKTINNTDFTTINTIYQTYLSTGTTVSWVISETNYTVSSTLVHIDIAQRSFGTLGIDYLSEFTLTLTEA